MNPNFLRTIILGQVDEAGPLWLLLESALESLPVKPKWILLAGLAILGIAALAAFIVASYKRRK